MDKHKVVAGILATIAGSAVIEILAASGVSFATPVTEIAVSIVLYTLYREPFSRPGSVSPIMLVAIGLALAAVWVAVWGGSYVGIRTVDVDSALQILWVFFALVVVAPIYEEKIVRGLILEGLREITSAPVAVLAVSILFAGIHYGEFWWALLASCIIGAIKVRFDLTSLQTALIHGVINALVLMWNLASHPHMAI